MSGVIGAASSLVYRGAGLGANMVYSGAGLVSTGVSSVATRLRSTSARLEDTATLASTPLQAEEALRLSLIKSLHTIEPDVDTLSGLHGVASLAPSIEPDLLPTLRIFQEKCKHLADKLQKEETLKSVLSDAIAVLEKELDAFSQGSGFENPDKIKETSLLLEQLRANEAIVNSILEKLFLLKEKCERLKTDSQRLPFCPQSIQEGVVRLVEKYQAKLQHLRDQVTVYLDSRIEDVKSNSTNAAKGLDQREATGPIKKIAELLSHEAKASINRRLEVIVGNYFLIRLDLGKLEAMANLFPAWDLSAHTSKENAVHMIRVYEHLSSWESLFQSTSKLLEANPDLNTPDIAARRETTQTNHIASLEKYRTDIRSHLTLKVSSLKNSSDGYLPLDISDGNVFQETNDLRRLCILLPEEEQKSITKELEGIQQSASQT